MEKDADNIDAINFSMRKVRSISFTDKSYKMDHIRRGKAIIFNHYRFMNVKSERKGTESDISNLKKALLRFGFEKEDIIIHEDLKAADISHELEKVRKEDHTNNDLLMVFVLTHGNQNDKISAYDVEYPVECLWQPFRADKCKTLAGKPKIFFVVACRGPLADTGHKLPLLKPKPDTEVDAKPIEFVSSYSIPVWSDFLYVFSTYKGYLSYRNLEEGTWFIQAFCDELFNTDISEISFMDFLTAVNGRLSRLFETGSLWELRKQIPIFSSTLTKRLYFTMDKKAVFKE